MDLKVEATIKYVADCKRTTPSKFCQLLRHLVDGVLPLANWLSLAICRDIWMTIASARAKFSVSYNSADFQVTRAEALLPILVA